MFNRGIHIVKIFIKYLLIVSLASVLYNNLANGHMHKLSDGKKVYHAHPYSNTTHTHTTGQFLLLQTIFDLFNTVIFAALFSVILLTSTILYHKRGYKRVLNPIFQSFQNKAPPIVSLNKPRTCCF
jgi:hypothetical protein